MKRWLTLSLAAITATLSIMITPSISMASPSPNAPQATVPASVIRGLQATAERLAQDGTRHICYQAYVENIGWQGQVCDGLVAGTTHMSLRMEALAMVTTNVSGVCANAYLSNIGFQGQVCGADGTAITVGTEGQSRAMEAITIQVGTGTICVNAHLANIGWQGQVCGNPVFRGTEHQSRQMEAITISV
jgi:uncharacterized protein YjdB